MKFQYPGNIITFRLQVLKYTFVITLVLQAGSMRFLGLDIPYSYGLLLGTCVSIISFNILLFMSGKVLSSGRKMLAPLGYFIRIPIYCFAFYMSMRVGFIAGVSCLIGFFTTTIAMICICGIKPFFSKRKARREAAGRPEAPEGPESADAARENTETEE